MNFCVRSHAMLLTRFIGFMFFTSPLDSSNLEGGCVESSCFFQSLQYIFEAIGSCHVSFSSCRPRQRLTHIQRPAQEHEISSSTKNGVLWRVVSVVSVVSYFQTQRGSNDSSLWLESLGSLSVGKQTRSCRPLLPLSKASFPSSLSTYIMLFASSFARNCAAGQMRSPV